MSNDLILIRHGESRHHVDGLTGGWTDTPLTRRGREQAKRLGRAMAAEPVGPDALLLSSDLLRARETAEILANATGLTPHFHPGLRELNNGIARDKTVEEAEQLALPVTQPTVDWVPYAGAESWRTMTKRVMAFMKEEVSRHPPRPVVIVSHGNAMVAIVHWWLGLEERYWSSISFEFDCASISRLSVNRWGERTISSLNDASHLSDM